MTNNQEVLINTSSHACLCHNLNSELLNSYIHPHNPTHTSVIPVHGPSSSAADQRPSVCPRSSPPEAISAIQCAPRCSSVQTCHSTNKGCDPPITSWIDCRRISRRFGRRMESGWRKGGLVSIQAWQDFEGVCRASQEFFWICQTLTL